MNFIIFRNIVLFLFITGNHFSKGNVPGINLNFSCGDIVSKYLSKNLVQKDHLLMEQDCLLCSNKMDYGENAPLLGTKVMKIIMMNGA